MAPVRSSRTRLEFQVSLDRTSPLPRERWPEHRGDYVDVFQPYAERYRRRKRFAIWLFIGSLIGASVFFSINIFDALTGPVTVLIMVGLLVAGLTLAFGRKLVCPSCRKRLEPARGSYCPQCGCDQLEKGKHAYCPSCESRIIEDDGDSARNYRIHGCTHCGVMLDEKGI